MVLRLLDSWSNWNLEMLVFEERGKPEYTEKNLSEQGREPTTNSTHIWRRFEPGPHWWEASALNTAPPLLPKKPVYGGIFTVSTKLLSRIFALHSPLTQNDSFFKINKTERSKIKEH